MAKLENQPCPMCGQKTLTLQEDKIEVPFFNELFVFSMSCSSCKYHKADVEAIEQHDPVKFSFEISSEDDLKVRVVKSSQATVKIPHLISIDPGPASNGYVTNVEGILNRMKSAIESARDSEDDPVKKKRAKKLLKKLTRVMWGQESVKLIIEDPSGNSAIISDKAKKSKL